MKDSGVKNAVWLNKVVYPKATPNKRSKDQEL